MVDIPVPEQAGNPFRTGIGMGAADPRTGDQSPNREAPVKFVPTGSLFWLLIKNLFLTIVTLGVYRFWARTAVRRYLWNGVEIAGDPLEYTGRGMELFLGFLTVLAIFIPIMAVYSGLTLWATGQVLALAVLKIVYLVSLSMLIIVAQFRARRYRLSRTVWRGIRAGQDGSTWTYLGISVGWGLLSVMTLGIAVPWARRATERYRTNHTWFGDHRFEFAAKSAPLIGRWLTFLAVGILPAAVGIAIIVWVAPHLSAQPWRAQQGGYFLPLGIGVICLFVALVTGMAGYIDYAVAEFRYFAASTSLGAIRFESGLRTGWVIWRLMLFAALALVILIGSLSAAGYALFHAYSLLMGGVKGQVKIPTSANSIALIVGAVFAVVVLFSSVLIRLLRMIMIEVPLIRKICETLMIENPTALDGIGRSPLVAPRYGEGLADSFDIGAI